MHTGKQLGAAIESARKLKKMSKKALADHFDIRPPSIHDWVNRGTIDKDKLPKLWALFSDVVGPEHWGLGEGYVDRSSDWGSWGDDSGKTTAEFSSSIKAAERLKEDSDDIIIPAYRSSAGDPYLEPTTNTGQIKSITVTRQWLTSNVLEMSSINNLRIITGFSTVMRPMFNPGDPLLLDIGVNHVEKEGVYFFKLNGEAFIKIIQRVPVHNQQTHRLRIVSKNADFLPIEIAASEGGLDVIGRVLTAWRSEQF